MDIFRSLYKSVKEQAEKLVKARQEGARRVHGPNSRTSQSICTAVRHSVALADFVGNEKREMWRKYLEYGE